MNDLIEILHEGKQSLVVANGEVCTFDGRGVSDLFQLLKDDAGFLNDSSVADKVVGKAAAALMALAKIKEVYADVISTPALDLLKSNNISTTYGKVVPHIVNRAGTGFCPLETRCMACNTLEECFVQISAFIEEMRTNTREK